MKENADSIRFANQEKALINQSFKSINQNIQQTELKSQGTVRLAVFTSLKCVDPTNIIKPFIQIPSSNIKVLKIVQKQSQYSPNSNTRKKIRRWNFCM